jgi:drug/metabolite transporter (DMT)-like permease
MVATNTNSLVTVSDGKRAPSRLAAVLGFFAIYVIWGSTYLAIHYAVETIPPLITAGARQLTAGSILLAIAWKRGFRPTRAHWLSGLVVGAFFFLGGHGTLHWAEKYVSSGLAALLIATEPMWILLIGSGMGQEKMNWKNGLGLLMGLTGVGILTGGDFSLHSAQTWIMLIVVAGALSWALGVCLTPRLRLPSEAMGRAAIPLICGAVLLLLTAAGVGEFHDLRGGAVTLRSLLGLGYLILFGSVIAFTAYTWLLEHYSPTLVATHTFVNPVVAVLLGWWLAGEVVGVRVAAATAAILIAILLIQQGDRRAMESEV